MLPGFTSGVSNPVGLEETQEFASGAGSLVMLTLQTQDPHLETTYFVFFWLFPFLQFAFWYSGKTELL